MAIPPALFFCSRLLWHCGHFVVPREFHDVFGLFFTENDMRFLIGIAFNLQMAFGRMATFTVLILPIHSMGGLSTFSVILSPFLQRCQFPLWWPFTFLVGFILDMLWFALGCIAILGCVPQVGYTFWTKHSFFHELSIIGSDFLPHTCKHTVHTLHMACLLNKYVHTALKLSGTHN